MKTRLKIGHLVLMFVLVALPFAATFALYYPDERHYTDGALMMLKHGDWLMPQTAAGTPRFQKPPLAYWAVAASYLTFGVGVLASRLPFLLASCGTLWLTYRLARRLTGNPEAAMVAAIVLLSQPQFFFCSIRSMPDALLVFFTTLSAYGFLRLIALEEFTAGAFWMAYGGAAGAALSKGLLGAGIVLFAWAFVFWQKRDWRAVGKIIHLPSLATALVLVVSGFGYVLSRHGTAALADFLDDQVTGNLDQHWWSPLWRLPVFALVLLVNFLPWSATVVEWLVRKKAIAGSVPSPARKFILVWTGLLVAGFAFGTNVSVRYLLPATPLMAVLFADWLQCAEGARLIFSVRRILWLVLAVLGLAVVGIYYTVSEWPLPAVLAALTCSVVLAGIGVLGWGALRNKSLSASEALGLAMLLGWLAAFTAAMPILLPDRAQQIAAVLRQTGPDAASPVLLVGDVKLASRVRVLLGKNWTVVHAGYLKPADLEHYTRILISEKAADLFTKRGWSIQTAAANFSTPKGRELWAALKSRRLPALLAHHEQKICLAIHP